jgi:predicted unusual protein kinase regulating ubiquinone biosynthesis (AarF/ABC1/UbiB family)/nucleotide-binding universal stress UspA family protein
VQRVVVATDRSKTAERAVAWAGELAGRYSAELVLLQVIPENGEVDVEAAEESLYKLAREIAGERGRAAVRVHADPPQAIVDVAEAEGADVLVVGNAGMSGRKEFLLGNVPNRISHNARCTVVIVNTTDGMAAPVVVQPDGEDVSGDLFARAARIGRIVGKYGLAERAEGHLLTVKERAQRLREALEQLGPTFSKLGQILSTRPGLLPQEFVDELAHLQDRVPPLTQEEVVAVMEQELRVPWEDVFASIDPEPLAAGTIGQVHRATLEDGDRVVIKVQRPNAREEIARDLGLLELFAEKAAERPALRELIDIPVLAQNLSESLRRELDFRQEAENIERMREVLQSYELLDVPRLYPELTTSRLLVMEEIQGVPIRDAPESDARPEAARQLLEAYYRQVLLDGFFHADPHPGNLLWWNDRVYFIDLGMVGEVEPRLRELILLLLLAFLREDAHFLAEVMLMLADDAAAEVDMEALEGDFAAFIARYRSTGSLKDIDIGAMLEEMVEIGGRHRIQLPAALALSGKAFGQMQLAVAALDPSLDAFSVIGSFLRRSLGERARVAASPQQLFYEAQKLKVRVGRLIESVERMTGARPGGRMQVEFIGSREIEAAITRTGRRLIVAAALTAGAVAWLASGAARSRRQQRP